MHIIHVLQQCKGQLLEEYICKETLLAQCKTLTHHNTLLVHYKYFEKYLKGYIHNLEYTISAISFETHSTKACGKLGGHK